MNEVNLLQRDKKSVYCVFRTNVIVPYSLVATRVSVKTAVS